MRKKIIVPVSALLGMLFFCSCAGREPTDCVVTFVEGDVELKKAGTKSFEEVSQGEVLAVGDTIRTGDGSMADIKFGKGSGLRLKEATTLDIKGYESAVGAIMAKLKLVSGIILCRLEKLKRKSSFEVSTRVAVTGIRGTDFLVESVEEDLTKVMVLDGTVEVRSATVEASPIVVGYHEKTLIYRGSPPRPAEKLLMEEIDRLEEVNLINIAVVIKVAKAVAESADVKNLKAMLENFYATEGTYPEELQELVEKGYTRKIPKDRWRSNLYYSISDDREKYVLISPGPDRRLGNEDDIKY